MKKRRIRGAALSDGKKKAEALRNAGIYISRKSAAHPSQRTFVVLGAGRGGTSMIAGLLARLGVPMGANGVLYEDEEIRDITKKFPKEEWFRLLTPLFEDRNRKHDVWGLKVLRLSRLLKELEESLRNPYFIFVFRDPIAISVRNQVSADLDFFHTMNYTLGTYRLFAQYMESSKVPYIALSYEKSLIEPKLTVTTLADFLGLSITKRLMSEAIRFVSPSPEDYVLGSVTKQATSEVSRQ
jgi:hypothetical protein